MTMDPSAHEQTEVLPEVYPWRRWGARFYDYALTFIALQTLNEYYLHTLIPDVDLSIVVKVIPPLVWVFVESVLISKLGTTPGKWLFNIRVSTEAGDLPTLLQSLNRSFNVWLRGLAFNVVLLSVFAMIIAYSKLLKHGQTTWDVKAGTVVHVEKLDPVRYALIIVIGLLFAWLIYFAE